MIDEAALVYDNMIYRIEALTPSYVTIGPNTFKCLNSRAVGEDETARDRTFKLHWINGGNAMGVSDGFNRTSVHTWQAEFFYNAESVVDHQLYRMILRDQRDLVKLLEDSSKYKGTSAAAPTATTGLAKREVIPRLDRLPHQWRLGLIISTMLTESYQ